MDCVNQLIIVRLTLNTSKQQIVYMQIVLGYYWFDCMLYLQTKLSTCNVKMLHDKQAHLHFLHELDFSHQTSSNRPVIETLTPYLCTLDLNTLQPHGHFCPFYTRNTCSLVMSYMLLHQLDLVAGQLEIIPE